MRKSINNTYVRTKETKYENKNAYKDLRESYSLLGRRMNLSPSSPEVQSLVGRCFGYISNNYYDCTLEMYNTLAGLYVTDEKFIKAFEEYGPGFSKFYSDAIMYYCDLSK